MRPVFSLLAVLAAVALGHAFPSATPGSMMTIISPPQQINTTFAAAVLSLHNEGTYTAGVPNVTATLVDSTTLLSVFRWCTLR